jgi:type II secretory pathway component GspD/PulD (secretin)
VTTPIRTATATLLSATLALLAQAAHAGEATEPVATPPVAAAEPAATAPASTPAAQPTVDRAGAEAALADFQAQEANLRSQREAVAAYHYDQGIKLRDAGRLGEGIDNLQRAVDFAPDNRSYRDELAKAKAMAGIAPDTGALAGDQAANELLVKQQLLLHEAESRLDEGKRQLTAGEYDNAERSFEQAAIRLQSLPFAEPTREARLRESQGLAEEARARRRKAEVAEQSTRNQAAVERSQQQRAASIQRERDTIDANLARAERARQRRDYDRAIMLCDSVLKMNRAEARAGDLLAQCRRERHDYLRQITADRWDEEHKLLSEGIRKAMLPQLEVVRFTMDPASTLPARSSNGDGTQQEAAWVKTINNQLEQEVTLDFQQQPVDEVIKFLQRVTGVNIITDPKVLAASPPPVDLKVERMKLRFVLDYVMKLTQLTYTLRGEAIYITNAEGAVGSLTTKMYDVRDLMHGIPNFPGPELEVPAPGGTVTRILPPIEPEVQPNTQELIEIIQKVVAPSTWTSPGVSAPSEYNGSLIVTQSAEVHKQIDTLLRSLRNQRGKQIHIKCKFLTIDNMSLEEIGVAWRNFQGNPRAAAGAPGSVPLPGQGTTGGVPPDPGVPSDLGFYFGDAGTQMLTGARVNPQLQSYTTSSSMALPGNNDGAQFQTQTWQITTNLYASAVINAVEKEHRGNILFEPACTIFNGQQAHIVHMNQQAYVGDYDVVQGQYDPILSVLSYGTVLDVQGIASADNKYITMTLKPTHTRVLRWRRFGGAINPNNPFPGGAVLPPAGNAVANAAPLLIPEMIYQNVRTSVTIPDGGSLVIAGMTNGESSRAHAGVPFLSHIPFLGRLFSNNGRTETEIKTLVVVQGDIVLFDEIESSL